MNPTLGTGSVEKVVNSTSESRGQFVRLLGFAPFDDTYGDWERLERDFFYKALGTRDFLKNVKYVLIRKKNTWNLHT